MSCEQFQHLVVDYGALDAERRHTVDAHLQACEHCRAFRDALDEADAALARELGSVRFSPGFAASVLRQASQDATPRRPSFGPELLDLAGWAGVLAIVAAAALPFVSRLDVSQPVLWLATGGCALTVALAAGIRALVDLNAD